MKSSPSSLYLTEIRNLEKKLTRTIDRGLADGDGKAKVFFRADDIGVPSQMFAKMVYVFQNHRIPLCLAVVPGWLTEQRHTALKEITGKSSLFCWHQHGWIHKNHEISGKKQEFGESRSKNELLHDLQRGKSKLSRLLGDEFCQVFTPPWNRCGQAALNIIEELGFRAISRSLGANPEVPAGFLDFQINVDLHTRKEEDPASSLTLLLAELQRALGIGTAGIMLHHQRMNGRALFFLNRLLCHLSSSKNIQTVHFQDLLG